MNMRINFSEWTQVKRLVDVDTLISQLDIQQKIDMIYSNLTETGLDAEMRLVFSSEDSDAVYFHDGEFEYFTYKAGETSYAYMRELAYPEWIHFPEEVE